MLRFRRAALVLGAIVSSASETTSAGANPWDLYGANARAIGMAGGHTAFADDFTAVYYNPASLAMATSAGFGMGLTLSRPHLALTFEKADRSIDGLDPPGADGVMFGSILPLGGSGEATRSRVALGLGISVPTRSLLSGQALDPAVPHWYMYQSLPSRLVAAFGIGVLPFDWLSLGMGVQTLAGVSGALDYALDVVAGRFSRKSVILDIDPVGAPLLGIEVRPLPRLRVGLAYRSEIESVIDVPVDLEITGIASLLVSTTFRVQYTPHQIALGASYEIADIGVRIAADATYALWSRAPDPSVGSSIDVGGELFESAGLGEVFDAPARGQERSVELAFRNILIPRIGLEKTIDVVSLRAGYGVRPSPAPVQTSGTNYVDATSHQLSLGAGLAIADPLEILANPIAIDVGASIFLVARRHYEKIDPRDPVGSFDASGSILVVSAGLRYDFREGGRGAR